MSNIARILISLSFIVFVLSPAQAQKKSEEEKIEAPEMIINPKTGQVLYSEVVELDGTAAKHYQKCLGWFNNYYVNPSDVIREKDEAGGKITGKARFRIFNPKDPKSGMETQAGIVMYTITVSFKDGKYKYDITEINWKTQSYFGIEKWIEENNKSYSRTYAHYLVLTDNEINKTIANLKETMAAKPEKTEDW